MHARRHAALAVFMIFAAGAVGADGGLRVGAARIDVTGPPGPSQAGKYDHEKVYVRAIVLDNGTARAALVSVESGPFDWTSTLSGVATELGSPVENVILSGTHTHSGSAAPSPRPGGAPASAAAVLTFFEPGGEPIAAYVNYAMHPINGYVLGVVSGDFPGAMSRYVEKAFGDDVVVAFSQGSAGDQNPLYLRPSNNAMATRAGKQVTGFEIDREASEGVLRDAAYRGPAARDADPETMDALLRFIESEGQVLGEEVIRVMTWTRKATGDPRIMGLQKVVSCPARKRTNSLVGTRAKGEAPLRNTVLVTSANGRLGGYVPDDASYGHQTFQVLNTILKPGCAETAIVNTIADLETQYLNAR